MNTELYKRFTDKFHAGKQKPVSESKIDKYQKKMSSVFPESYQLFMKNHGTAFCPDIIMVMEDDSEVWPLQNVWDLKSVLKTTKDYVKAGMPNEYIAFATDNMGNAFCFEQTQTRQKDAPVFLYDHDFDKVSKVANSFDEWLQSYLDLTEK